jgi:putative glutamine amidotransferase
MCRKDHTLKPRIGIVPSLIAGQLRINEDYAARISDAGGIPFVLSLDETIVACYENTIDGLLLSGGGDLDPAYFGAEPVIEAAKCTMVDRRRTECEYALLHALSAQGKPILGVCYGMQVMNVFWGGTLYQDIARQCPDALDHRTGTHMINLTSQKCLNLPDATACVNSSHHQAVLRVGDGFEIFARAEDGIIEGIAHETLPFCVAVQWHPERMPDAILSQLLFTAFIDAARQI